MRHRFERTSDRIRCAERDSPATAPDNDVGRDRYADLYLRKPAGRHRHLGKSAAFCLAVMATAACAIAMGPPDFDLVLQSQGGGSISAAEESKTESQIKQDLNESVAQGMMNVSMASVVEVDNEMNAHVGIVNARQNRLDQRIEIIAQDGMKLYSSPTLSPGEAIETARLSGSIPDGISEATAIFTGIDPESGKTAGSIALEITINRKGSDHAESE